jgi:hypothetical protein
MLEKFKNDVEKQQVEQMTDWQTKLVMMDSKERQYVLQVSNYKVTGISGKLCNPSMELGHVWLIANFLD